MLDMHPFSPSLEHCTHISEDYDGSYTGVKP